MLLRHAACVLALLAVPVLAWARDPVAVANEAKNEVAAELAECSAFYNISAEGANISLAPGPTRDDAVAKFRKSGEVAFTASAELTAPDIALARVSLATQSMAHEMQGSWERFSIIAAEYTFPCKDRVEHPDQRFAYWLTEKEKLPDVPK